MTFRVSQGRTARAGVYASRPASGAIIGERYRPTDGGPDFVWDGTLWRPDFETTLGYEPPSTSWTVTDGGTGAAGSFSKGTYELSSTSMSSSVAIAIAVRTFSGSGDFDLIARIRQVHALRNSSGGEGTFTSGIILRDSGTGNLGWLIMENSKTSRTKRLSFSTFSSQTSWAADLIRQDVSQTFDDAHVWMRITDTSSTRNYFVSNDGVRWWQIYTASGGSRYPVTPNQAGLAHQGFVDSGTPSYDSGVRLESWKVA